MRSEAAKKKAKALGFGLVLTVLEAKGLEFDDVFLFNFFTDSPATEDEWRAINSYTHSTAEAGATVAAELRIVRNFAENRSTYTCICEELKQLYTAFTRARVSLFIYDENTRKRGPLYNALKTLGLVKVLNMQTVTQELQGENLDLDNDELANVVRWRCRCNTPQEYQRGGERLYEQKLYDAASLMFEKSGDKARESQARGHLLMSSLKQDVGEEEVREQITAAGYQFLQSQLPAELEYAIRIFNKLGCADSQFYDFAVGIALKLGGQHVAQAASLMIKLKRHDRAAELFESQSDWRAASKSWEDHDHGRGPSFLEKAIAALERGAEGYSGYTNTGHAAEIQRLARVLAERYCVAGDFELMSVMIPKLGTIKVQIEFLENKRKDRRAVCAKILLDLLKRHGMFGEAAKRIIARADPAKNAGADSFFEAAEVLQKSTLPVDQLLRAKYLMAHHVHLVDSPCNRDGLATAIDILERGCIELPIAQLLGGSERDGASGLGPRFHMLVASFNNFAEKGSSAGQAAVLATVLQLKLEAAFLQQRPLSNGKLSKRVVSSADDDARVQVVLCLMKLCCNLLVEEMRKEAETGVEDPYFQLSLDGATVSVDVSNVTFLKIARSQKDLLKAGSSSEAGGSGGYKASPTRCRQCIKKWAWATVAPHVDATLQGIETRLNQTLVEQMQPQFQWRLRLLPPSASRGWESSKWKILPCQVQASKSLIKLSVPRFQRCFHLLSSLIMCVWDAEELAVKSAAKNERLMQLKFSKQRSMWLGKLPELLLEVAQCSPLLQASVLFKKELELWPQKLAELCTSEVNHWARKNVDTELGVLQVHSLSTMVETGLFHLVLKTISRKHWPIKAVVEELKGKLATDVVPVAELLVETDPRRHLDYLMHLSAAGESFTTGHLALLELASLRLLWQTAKSKILSFPNSIRSKFMAEGKGKRKIPLTAEHGDVCVLLMCNQAWSTGSEASAQTQIRQLFLILLVLIADRANILKNESVKPGDAVTDLLCSESHGMLLTTALSVVSTLSELKASSFQIDANVLCCISTRPGDNVVSFDYDAAVSLCDQLTTHCGDSLRTTKLKSNHKANVRVLSRSATTTKAIEKWGLKIINRYKSQRVHADLVLIKFLKTCRLAEAEQQNIVRSVLSFDRLLQSSPEQVRAFQLSKQSQQTLQNTLAKRVGNTRVTSISQAVRFLLTKTKSLEQVSIRDLSIDIRGCYPELEAGSLKINPKSVSSAVGLLKNERAKCKADAAAKDEMEKELVDDLMTAVRDVITVTPTMGVQKVVAVVKEQFPRLAGTANSKNVRAAMATARAAAPNPGAAAESAATWSKEEQVLLEEGVKEFPSALKAGEGWRRDFGGREESWQKISTKVSSWSPEECKERYKQIVAMEMAKAKEAAAAGDETPQMREVAATPAVVAPVDEHESADAETKTTLDADAPEFVLPASTMDFPTVQQLPGAFALENCGLEDWEMDIVRASGCLPASVTKLQLLDAGLRDQSASRLMRAVSGDDEPFHFGMYREEDQLQFAPVQIQLDASYRLWLQTPRATPRADPALRHGDENGGIVFEQQCLRSWGLSGNDLWILTQLFDDIEACALANAAQHSYCEFCGSWLDCAAPESHLTDAHFESHHSFKLMKATYDKSVCPLQVVASHCLEKRSLLTYDEREQWGLLAFASAESAQTSQLLLQQEASILARLAPVATATVQFAQIAFHFQNQPDHLTQFLQQRGKHESLEQHRAATCNRIHARPWATMELFYRDQVQCLGALIQEARQFREQGLAKLRWLVNDSRRAELELAVDVAEEVSQDFDTLTIQYQADRKDRRKRPGGRAAPRGAAGPPPALA